MERPVVGIDAVAAYVPRLYVDLTKEWAIARAPVLTEGSVDALVGKVTGGVGVRRMAIADAHQDCATLAANAVKRLIDAAGIDPREVDYIAVGTETTVDQSKSIAAYVLGMLERHYGMKLEGVGAPQMQFACIGAMYALEAAVSRLRAGENTKPYAIVVASDIARYPLASPGEYTQGAGAVAVLVCENPRLLALEPGLSATITRDERDFFRPNWSANAVVDGKYSIDVYLDCIQAAWDGYARRAESLLRIGKGELYDQIDYFLFHVPFPRMAEYAALRTFSELWWASPSMREQVVSAVTGASDLPRKDLERALAKTPLFRDAFTAKVAQSLSLARDVGNVYSGSLFLALVSLLEQTRDRDLTGNRVVLSAYGSGASAKVLSGRFTDRYARIADSLRMHDELRDESEGGTRVAVGLAEYERLHRLSDVELDPETRAWRIRPRGRSLVPPRGEFALERLGTTASPQMTDVGYRYYGWVPC